MMNTSRTEQPEQIHPSSHSKQTHLISSHTRSFQISWKVKVFNGRRSDFLADTVADVMAKLPNEQNQTSTEDQIQTPPQNDLKK